MNGYSKEMNEVLNRTTSFVIKGDLGYITPEVMLDGIVRVPRVIEVAEGMGIDIKNLTKDLDNTIIENSISNIRSKVDYSNHMKAILTLGYTVIRYFNVKDLEIEHVLAAITTVKDSAAAYILSCYVDDLYEFYMRLSDTNTRQDVGFKEEIEMIVTSVVKMGSGNPDDIMSAIENIMGEATEKEENNKSSLDSDKKWKGLVTCLNDTVSDKPIIGRQAEIDRTIEILARESKNNPVHVGEAGVGKTKIVEGLVQKINSGDVPNCIKNSRVYQVDLTGIVAGTKYRGEFEQKIKYILDNAEKEEKCILYFDEIHTISGAGNAEGGLDAANILKPYLTRGKLKMIGATTYKEYKQYIEPNAALNRRFQKIDVLEPSRDDAIKIINGLRDYYENFHKVCYTDDALESAVDLSIKYLPDRMLPDKVIDIIDEAGAYIKAHELKDTVVSRSLIEEVVSKMGHVPVDSIQETEIDKLKTLEKDINSVVLGQEEATKGLVQQIKLNRAGLGDSTKPIASMLFVGPTGVGKTEMAKTLANKLGMKLIRFDMSEYMEKNSVSKLIGSPAGYVGYEDGGLLVDEVRKNPSCVLLLDEIEKAHPDVFNALLQVMDYATLTDNKGNKADFKNAIIIMTSNVGARDMGKRGIGFGSSNEIGEVAIDEGLKSAFSPEFRNRLSKVVKFNSINKELATKIAKLKVDKLIDLVKAKKVDLKVTNKCIEYIVEKGIGIEVGARELDRVINSELKTLLVDEMLFGKLSNGGSATIDLKDGKPYLVKHRN